MTDTAIRRRWPGQSQKPSLTRADTRLPSSARKDLVLLGPDLNRFQTPDFVGVLLDGAVCREPTHVSHIEDRLLCPLKGVAVGLAQSFLAIDVRAVVGEHKVIVTAAAKEGLENALKQVGILATEEPVADLIDRAA